MTITESPAYPAVFAGYEERRAALRKWVAAHYVLAFDLEPGRMLDVGCGEGFWGSLFSELGHSVSGFDPCVEYIEAGRHKYPDLNLRVGTAEDPPFDSTFDLVFCRGLPHFYAPELAPARAMLEGLTSRVEPTGLLLASCYSDGSGDDRPGLCGGLHRYHTYADLNNMVADAGWTIMGAHRTGNYLQIGARFP